MGGTLEGPAKGGGGLTAVGFCTTLCVVLVLWAHIVLKIFIDRQPQIFPRHLVFKSSSIFIAILRHPSVANAQSSRSNRGIDVRTDCEVAGFVFGLPVLAIAAAVSKGRQA